MKICVWIWVCGWMDVDMCVDMYMCIPGWVELDLDVVVRTVYDTHMPLFLISWRWVGR